MKTKTLNPSKINNVVAKELGWKKCPNGSWQHLDVMKRYRNWNMLDSFPYPDYCGSIEAAWYIVDYILKTGGTFKYQTMYEGKRGHFVTIGYLKTPISSFYEHVYVEAKTASLAICLAFLKARRKIKLIKGRTGS